MTIPTLSETDEIRIIHMTEWANEILSWELKLALKNKTVEFSVLGIVAFKLRVC